MQLYRCLWLDLLCVSQLRRAADVLPTSTLHLSDSSSACKIEVHVQVLLQFPRPKSVVPCRCLARYQSKPLKLQCDPLCLIRLPVLQLATKTMVEFDVLILLVHAGCVSVPLIGLACVFEGASDHCALMEICVYHDGVVDVSALRTFRYHLRTFGNDARRLY